MRCELDVEEILVLSSTDTPDRRFRAQPLVGGFVSFLQGSLQDTWLSIDEVVDGLVDDWLIVSIYILLSLFLRGNDELEVICCNI